MRHRPELFALVVAFLVSACTEPPETHSDPPPDNEPPAAADAGDTTGGENENPSIQFAASKDAAESDAFQDEFGLLEQRDIHAVFDVPDQSGVRFVKLDILNPQDVLHKTIWQAISTDADAPARATHPESGYEVRVTPVEAEDGRVQLRIAIPIAGTQFTQFKLTGTFTAEAWANQEADSPHVTGSFTLVQ